ncbi:MAG: YajQ family cyclic di-GMP-binding protein, partial [Nitrospirae bacterium]
MPEQHSFDIVSKVHMQELKNAVEQTRKEIGQRFDFKGTKTELTLKEKESELVIVSDDEYKLRAVIDILQSKCVKRNVSLKALNYGKVESALGGTVRQTIAIQNGIPDDKAKVIVKRIRDGKFKVQAQIQG